MFDPSRRIIGFNRKRSALLLHFEEVNPLAIEHSLGAYNYVVDSSSYSHEVDRVDYYIPSHPHYFLHSSLDPKIGNWGKFDNGLRSWSGHLRWNHHEVFNFQNDNFTIDFWFKTTSPSPSQFGNWGYIHMDYTSSQQVIDSYIKLGFNDSGKVYTSVRGFTLELGEFWFGGYGPTYFTGDYWNHVALVKNGTSHRLYLNGVIEREWTLDTYFVAPSTNSHIFEGAGWVFIPNIGDPPNVTSFTYSDELHIEREAIYTEPFTPPTEPYGG